jgi:hypothetical protein
LSGIGRVGTLSLSYKRKERKAPRKNFRDGMKWEGGLEDCDGRELSEGGHEFIEQKSSLPTGKLLF